ncbi:cell cycle checkpoint control protein RAD9A [Geosmithia morbida]|uniref:DNA repair protein rad9 n=1 Tax=Geosmithia morbida TaxID=1094350 RepID=A0A9P4YNA6_9HYPO|nr:cell cycle checkpoint control protein RAD9A [Geosmithia morbida]KAF4119730.1 cell cycle checkpoint control protein RAD9A [Geosmithia morbida]
MAVLNLTLSEEGVNAFRDALTCLGKFSDDVSLEARKESFVLTTLNTSKSAYASFRFSTNKFFSRYQYQGTGQYHDKFHCTLFIRALISLFRSRTSTDASRDADRHTVIDRCDVAIEDGEEGQSSRFISRIVFRNGLTSTHRMPFEVAVPVHAKFSKQDAPHHWTISSRTLRQLMDHFGPGIDFLDINTDGDHVNFTCFSEKTVSEDAVLKKPLQTSIAVEADEFDDIDVEDKLHIVISVKDFRAIIQHAGITGNDLSARYSLPARPIQITYSSDAIACEFLIMTVGERGSNPSQRTKKGHRSANQQQHQQSTGPRLEATSRRTSATPSEAGGQQQQQQQQRIAPEQRQPTSQAVHSMPPPPAASSRPAAPSLTPHTSSSARASASRLGAFDLRPTQRQQPQPPSATNQSESLFVDDEGWEPVGDDDDDEDNTRLEWDHSANPVRNHTAVHVQPFFFSSFLHLSSRLSSTAASCLIMTWDRTLLVYM